MFGLSLTKIGAVIGGIGGFILALPPTIVLGTYHGAVVTTGTLIGIVGTVMTIFGLRNAMQKNTDAVQLTTSAVQQK